MRSILIIGLGRFGTNLARKLYELGNEVLVADIDEKLINDLAPYVTRAQIGDCTDADVLRSLGVSNFDLCFVCISDSFQSSLEITSMLKELGAKHVVAKADREIHAKLLKKIGADDIIFPERDMAQRAAVKYSARYAFDYIELTPEYSIAETLPPESWIGRTVRDVDVRNTHRINIIGVKKDGRILPLTAADHVFSRDEHLIIAGGKRDVFHLMDKI